MERAVRGSMTRCQQSGRTDLMMEGRLKCDQRANKGREPGSREAGEKQSDGVEMVLRSKA